MQPSWSSTFRTVFVLVSDFAPDVVHVFVLNRFILYRRTSRRQRIFLPAQSWRANRSLCFSVTVRNTYDRTVQHVCVCVLGFVSLCGRGKKVGLYTHASFTMISRKADRMLCCVRPKINILSDDGVSIQTTNKCRSILRRITYVWCTYRVLIQLFPRPYPSYPPFVSYLEP